MNLTQSTSLEKISKPVLVHQFKCLFYLIIPKGFQTVFQIQVCLLSSIDDRRLRILRKLCDRRAYITLFLLFLFDNEDIIRNIPTRLHSKGTCTRFCPGKKN